MIAAAVCAVAADGLWALIALQAAKRYGMALAYRRLPVLAAFGALALFQLFIALQRGDAAAAPGIAVAAVGICAITDAQTGYVFDAVTIPATAAVLAIALSAHAFPGAACGAAACGGALLLLYAVTFGRGLGLGDVKLACCIGAALGAESGLCALGAAFVLGGAYAAYLFAARRARRGEAVAFAPFLAVGMGAAMMGGALI